MRKLRDSLGRDLHYLRLSVTDRCNFRCVYCLPNGCPKAPEDQPLSLAEISRLVRAFAGLGFWKVRLTGGEPTLRPDIVKVVEHVAGTPGIGRVGLTTNGHRLAALTSELREAGLKSLNVSLDSLDPRRFREITGSSRLAGIVAGIDAALAAGIPSVKVNVVLLRGMDDRELGRFLAWTRTQPLTVRFIELMETGENGAVFRRARLPAAEVREQARAPGLDEAPAGCRRRAGDELRPPGARGKGRPHLGLLGRLLRIVQPAARLERRRAQALPLRRAEGPPAAAPAGRRPPGGAHGPRRALRDAQAGGARARRRALRPDGQSRHDGGMR